MAPILFVSSNPSIGTASPDQYPTAQWDDADIVAYFEYRFGGHSLSSVSEGVYDHLPGSLPATRPTRFWVAMRARAGELLGKPVSALQYGEDYALSEVVHCKSAHEIGVREAATTCADRYLLPVLERSAALVIVGIGAFAGAALRKHLGLPRRERLIGPIEIAGRQRLVTFLPHPASFAKAKTFSALLDEVEMRGVSAWIREGR